MITDFRLKVFVTVANLMSFTKASIELNISQPAVTKHIKELERLLGESLFLRKGNSILLTSHGLSLLPFAKDILDKYNTLNDYFITTQDSFVGTIKLGASTTVAQYILPSILAKFNDCYPNVKVVLTTSNSRDIADAVVRGGIDFAIVEDDSINHSLHYEHFADDEIVLVTANKNVRESISVKDIMYLPLITREKGSGTLSVIEKAFNKKGIAKKELNIVMELGSSEGIIRYLLNSNSYAFISIVAVRDYLIRGKLSVIEVDGLNINRSFRFVSLHGKSNRLSESFKMFCINNYNK